MGDAEKIAKALKPPRCPECGSELHGFDYYVLELSRAFAHYDEPGGYLVYSNWDTIDTKEETAEFRCPECNALITRDVEEAEEILSGRK